MKCPKVNRIKTNYNHNKVNKGQIYIINFNEILKKVNDSFFDLLIKYVFE